MSSQLIPPAPVDSSIARSTQLPVTIVMATLAIAALLFGLAHWRRHGRPTVVLLWLSGGAMMAMEPLVDTVGACWFPQHGSWVAFTLWGRPMPWWLCCTYFVYFGIGASACWLFLRRGVTQAQVWWFFAGAMAGDAVMESVLLHFHTWIYYGDQPLVLARFPYWWAPVNALTTVVVAGLVLRLDRGLRGAQQLLIVPLAVCTSAGVNAAVGWPSWTAINSGFGPVARDLCGLVTFALACSAMRWVVRQVAVDAPEPVPVAPTGAVVAAR